MTAATMTPLRLSLLQLVHDQPLITAAVATRTLNQAVGAQLAALHGTGHLRVEVSQQINGQQQRGYRITDTGLRAVRRPTPSQVTAAPRTMHIGQGVYACPELRRTCQRPGAYDAFAYPSLRQGQREYPTRATS